MKAVTRPVCESERIDFAHGAILALASAKPDPRIHKLVAEITAIRRKRLALDEALRRRQIALARLEASSVSSDAPRFGPAINER